MLTDELESGSDVLETDFREMVSVKYALALE